ncbi:MAG: hypothetical protein R3F59_18765 [Myxococcota bacterium]
MLGVRSEEAIELLRAELAEHREQARARQGLGGAEVPEALGALRDRSRDPEP